jgi:phosphoadenosine phosphosulfate reductase
VATAPSLPELDFEAMSAEELLRWAAEEFGDKLCLTCSWQRQSSALVHMISDLGLGVDVVELDTLVLFPETYATRDQLVAKYDLKLKSFRPIDPPDRLWETDVDACCGIRKVEPLNRALKGLKAWITGLRREQAVTRSGMQKVELDKEHGNILKINPLVDWTYEEVWRYIRANEIPYNGLHDQGFPSIGCAPCTRAVKPGEDPRAGRWWWENSQTKECGLHFRSEESLSAVNT